MADDSLLTIITTAGATTLAKGGFDGLVAQIKKRFGKAGDKAVTNLDLFLQSLTQRVYALEQDAKLRQRAVQAQSEPQTVQIIENVVVNVAPTVSDPFSREALAGLVQLVIQTRPDSNDRAIVQMAIDVTQSITEAQLRTIALLTAIRHIRPSYCFARQVDIDRFSTWLVSQTKALMPLPALTSADLMFLTTARALAPSAKAWELDDLQYPASGDAFSWHKVFTSFPSMRHFPEWLALASKLEVTQPGMLVGAVLIETIGKTPVTIDWNWVPPVQANDREELHLCPS